jgi:DNA-binding TFAR19-related protein (PDSD5 family)
MHCRACRSYKYVRIDKEAVISANEAAIEAAMKQMEESDKESVIKRIIETEARWRLDNKIYREINACIFAKKE